MDQVLKRIENEMDRLRIISGDGKKEEGFIGRPFYLDYTRAYVLVSDAWKWKVKGIPQGAFLLAFYEGEENVEEVILLRVIDLVKLPSDNDVINSMIEYYKDNLDTSGRAGAKKENQLDDLTRYEFSFSGLTCRILGVFYKITIDGKEKIEFGADLENFYSANNYKVYKARGKVLEEIVNQRAGNTITGNENEFQIGKVRYSSTRRFQDQDEKVKVYISPVDFLGTRTALFGMTRTGKSNTVKKIIEATEEISGKAPRKLDIPLPSEEALKTLDSHGIPFYPVGQIIFDISGEYANENMQDEGTAIFELYKDDVIRYSVQDKSNFKIMKVNFYDDIEAGFFLIRSHFTETRQNIDYVNSFLSISLEKPEDYDIDNSVKIRYDRKVAAYKCCLYKAGFELPPGYKNKIVFEGKTEINNLVRKNNPIDPSRWISLDDACIWFEEVWNHYKEWDVFAEYRDQKGREWADEDLKALLVFLTRRKEPGSSAQVSGYYKLQPLKKLHSRDAIPFTKEIIQNLRQGKIIIVDLSQGELEIQKIYSEKICQEIFNDAIGRFTENKPNNFIQFYFEEAHNLFPKKEDKELSQIYNRIAKEGAKLNLGLIYATQEVSSISSNILKNTQNWFISHLNNEDETSELKKYYDFEDFTDSLKRFNASSDKGFVRMKTYSNPFVVPVQIDKFLANRG